MPAVGALDRCRNHHRPAQGTQAPRHRATHVAHAHDGDLSGWWGARTRVQDGINRLDLAIDINMPSPTPSVIMAVPP